MAIGGIWESFEVKNMHVAVGLRFYPWDLRSELHLDAPNVT
jgi:hypothetical protein